MVQLRGYKNAKNWKVVVNGRKYDSKKESQVATNLQLMEKAGEIYSLRYQVRFDIVINDLKVCSYIADFVYKDSSSGREIVVDAKSDYSRKDKAYRLKKKLMYAVYGIEIQEA